MTVSAIVNGAYHREDFDFGFVPGRELIEREFECVRLDSETGWQGAGWGHPDVGMRCIFDSGADGETLVFRWEDVEYGFA